MDEHLPFKEAKWDRYPTGAPKFMEELDKIKQNGYYVRLGGYRSGEWHVIVATHDIMGCKIVDVYEASIDGAISKAVKAFKLNKHKCNNC